MLLINNRRVAIPFVEDIQIKVPVNTGTYNRKASSFTLTADDFISQIELPFSPVCTAWTEVFIDGVRLINPRSFNVTAGEYFESYNVSGSIIFFTPTVKVKGAITVICDTQPQDKPELESYTIRFDNVQGVKSAGMSLYFEPVVVARPHEGYARLSLDRKSLIYRPRTNFVGHDSFSYCLINVHGQQSRVRCVYIVVGNPEPPPPPPAPPPSPPPLQDSLFFASNRTSIDRTNNIVYFKIMASENIPQGTQFNFKIVPIAGLTTTPISYGITTVEENLSTGNTLSESIDVLYSQMVEAGISSFKLVAYTGTNMTTVAGTSSEILVE